MLTSTRQERQLEPRYRRILSFGDVLDESIGLFRRHWAYFALVSAVCLLPPGIIAVLLAASGVFDSQQLLRQIETTGAPDLARLSNLVASLALLYVVYTLFVLAWSQAVLVTTDEYLHAEEPKLGRIFGKVVRRYLPALGSAVVYGIVLILALVAATAIFVVSVVLLPIFVLASIGAIVGVVLWWIRPRMRSVWLKWLIIVATPFGLAAYVAGVWAMYLGPSILEHRGPIAALQRSSELVDHHWFRVIGILLVAATIVSVIQYVPTVLVQLPLTILAFSRGQVTLSPAETAISTAASIVTQVLCASMGSIVYAVLYVDLRNRRDGTDIAERVSQLEALETQPALPDV